MLKYTNSIFISKLNYHVELWGNCRKTLKTKIDDITLGIAIKIGENTIGRTNEFILKKLNWMNIEERYQMSIKKLTHKLINTDNYSRHFLSVLITENRNNRMLAENKLGPQKKIPNHDKVSSKTYTFKIINIYNCINRQLTLIKDHQKFKKCLKKLTLNPKTVFRISLQKDHTNLQNENCNNQKFISC